MLFLRHLTTRFISSSAPPPPQRNKLKVVLGVGAVALSGAYYATRNEQEKRFIRVCIGGIRRFVRSFTAGAKTSADYYYSLWGVSEEDPKYAEEISGIHTRAAQRILDTCLKNGGLYIKLGQGLVIMDHILPKEYISTLRVLQDKCLSRGSKEVQQLFKEDFNKPVEELFESFNEVPVAAASLAQVFKAKTKDGEEVAVKVQYIDLQDRFIGDIATVHILLKIAGFLHPDFDFAWVLKELKGTLEKELNFLNEAKNAEKCAKDLAHLKFVHVPKIRWDLSSNRVLTTEYIDGVKISDIKTLKCAGFSLADIDLKLFKCFSEQIFHTGFVHADPHPGNILVRKGQDRKAELVVLDHGLYEVLPTDVRESLRDLWKAIVLNDHPNMKKFSVKLGIAEEDYRLFCIAIGQRYIASIEPTEKDGDVVRLLLAPHGTRVSIRKLTPKERTKINQQIMVLRTRCMHIFKAMPSRLMLVTRNINTIRSIARGHGDPIDRYKTMARCATDRSFNAKQKSFSARVESYKGRIEFEVNLWWSGVKMWFIKGVLSFLSMFGQTVSLE